MAQAMSIPSRGVGFGELVIFSDGSVLRQAQQASHSHFPNPAGTGYAWYDSSRGWIGGYTTQGWLLSNRVCEMRGIREAMRAIFYDVALLETLRVEEILAVTIVCDSQSAINRLSAFVDGTGQPALNTIEEDVFLLAEKIRAGGLEVRLVQRPRTDPGCKKADMLAHRASGAVRDGSQGSWFYPRSFADPDMAYMPIRWDEN